MSKMTLVLGNQLFPLSHYQNFPKKFFMCEDFGLCTHFKYHKHKLIHFLASMRTYCKELTGAGFDVSYRQLAKKTFLEELESYALKNKIQELHCFEIEDKFFEKTIENFCKEKEIKLVIYESPMFMVSRNDFKTYLNEGKKPFLNNFYIQQRKRFSILMTENGEPIGGEWNYDQENRKKIPQKTIIVLFEPPLVTNKIVEDVKDLIHKNFPDHPGDVKDYWIPVSREDALKWFKDYIKNRFEFFGDYQDALDERCDFLYHSVISPFINIGFLTPYEVIKEIEQQLKGENLNAVEGFIRQVLGWREFVRGIYQNFDEIQQKENFFGHKKRLKKSWYEGTTGIPPLDFSINKALRTGYCHHIERLMVIGNLMLMLEVHPQEVYTWFMEMFIDSSDWVMGPNVFGMSQFSDGGIFATKPYISGSNYILKMSHYKKDPEWCDGVDGLYWRFIDKKRKFLEKNHRMNMMVKMYDKMDDKKKKRILKAADELEKRLVE